MTEAVASPYVGTRVVLRAVFMPAGSSTATDPTAVAAKVRKPDGTKQSLVYGVDPEVTRVSIGVYELRIVVDVRGSWWIGFAGTLGATPVAFDEVLVQVKSAASLA